MQENSEVEERVESDSGFRKVFGKAKGYADAARQVTTGEDIRRFDDFTDATTRAVVGIHQDQSDLHEKYASTRRELEATHRRERQLAERLSELQEQAVSTQREVEDAQRRERRLAERLDQMQEDAVSAQKAVRDIQQREQRLTELLGQLQEQAVSTRHMVDNGRQHQKSLTERLQRMEHSAGPQSGPPLWILGVAALALLLSIVAVAISVS